MKKQKFLKPQKLFSENVRTPDNLIKPVEFLVRLREELERMLIPHHSIYNQPPKGNYSEELIFNASNEKMGLGQIVDGTIFGFVPDSHAPGKDLCIPSLECPNISVKTGDLNKDKEGSETVTYSSHRMTKYKTLEDKLSFLSERHSDLTVLLTPDFHNAKYRLIAHEPLDFNKLDWVETFSKEGKPTGHRGSGGDEGILQAKIINSTSYQLWVTLRLDSKKIIYSKDICIS
jgi:hypothetical protein